MWRLGFFLHEIGFGLLSIFLPLYIFSLPGGSLFYVGLMASAALFVAIPASLFWGYICDKTRRYKQYILLAFLSSTVILYIFTLTTNLELLVLFYVVMSIFHMAHEPPKNVLISELYSRKDWDRSFAFYEGFTEVGWLVGLVMGFVASAYSFGAINTLLLCCVLNLAAFVTSVLLVADPSLIFERRLVSIERSLDFAHKGVLIATRIFDGVPSSEKLRRENVKAFGLGLVFFSLATGILFTPLPIFVSKIASQASLPQSIVFFAFILNSSGAITGYFLAGNRSQESLGRNLVARTVILRTLLAFLMIGVLEFVTFRVLLTTVLLTLMGFSYALFIVYTLLISMEIMPTGQAGLFNVLIGIGGGVGSFVGPFVAESYGFLNVFLVAGTVFLVSYLFFRFFV
jgi:MFS family permease